jgi:hypothetical protein
VIGDVVAVGIVRCRLQERREIAVTYPEVMEIRDEVSDRAKAQTPAELEPVGGRRDPTDGHYPP